MRCGGACQDLGHPCEGECLGTGRSLCGDRCVATKYLVSGHFRECEGRCLKASEQCGGTCVEGYQVCGSKCVNTRYSMEMGGFKTCGEDCVSKLSQCNGLCEDGFFACGKSSCRCVMSDLNDFLFNKQHHFRFITI